MNLILLYVYNVLLKNKLFILKRLSKSCYLFFSTGTTAKSILNINNNIIKYRYLCKLCTMSSYPVFNPGI